jgi:hypothetical protein
MFSFQFLCTKLNKLCRRIAFLCAPLQKYPYLNFPSWPHYSHIYDLTFLLITKRKLFHKKKFILKSEVLHKKDKFNSIQKQCASAETSRCKYGISLFIVIFNSISASKRYLENICLLILLDFLFSFQIRCGRTVDPIVAT